MIADNNRKATILAYYFSKFDRDAMAKLSYSTLTEAFVDLMVFLMYFKVVWRNKFTLWRNYVVDGK